MMFRKVDCLLSVDIYSCRSQYPPLWAQIFPYGYEQGSDILQKLRLGFQPCQDNHTVSVEHRWVAGSDSDIFRVPYTHYIPRQAAMSTKAQARYFTQTIS